MYTRAEILSHIDPEVRQHCGSSESAPPSRQMLFALWQENHIVQSRGQIQTMSGMSVSPLVIHPEVLAQMQALEYGADGPRMTNLQQARVNLLDAKKTSQVHVLTELAWLRLVAALTCKGMAERLVLEQVDHIAALNTKPHMLVMLLPGAKNGVEFENWHIMVTDPGGSVATSVYSVEPTGDRFFAHGSTTGEGIWQDYLVKRRSSLEKDESNWFLGHLALDGPFAD